MLKNAIKWILFGLASLIPFSSIACHPVVQYYQHNSSHSVVRFESKPGPAVIYIDGNKIDVTPLTVDLEIYQQQERNITAIPVNPTHYRQDITISAGLVPSNIYFNVDIKPLNSAPYEESNNSSLDPCSAPSPVLYFDIDVHRLSKKQTSSIEHFSQSLLCHDNLRIRIFGYADDTGTEQYNIRLSLQRAESVKATLIQLGVPLNSINLFGYGSVNAVNEHSMPVSLDYNRKVNFEIEQMTINTGESMD